jgi:hypothetical protein
VICRAAICMLMWFAQLWRCFRMDLMNFGKCGGFNGDNYC